VKGIHPTCNDTVALRIATPDDANALGSMHVASWRETYTGMLPDKMLSALSAEARASSWARIMRDPTTVGGAVIYLAEHKSTIIGFGSCGAQRAESLKGKGYDGEISAIYVLREFQHRGVGARLFAAMSLDLAGRGFSAAALWVLRDNLGARRFYERYAGQVIAEKEDVRDGTVLVELAYGWPNLSELSRLIAEQ
jgi:ribosomal protein S18 acetylase RimI-like enzyme